MLWPKAIAACLAALGAAAAKQGGRRGGSWEGGCGGAHLPGTQCAFSLPAHNYCKQQEERVTRQEQCRSRLRKPTLESEASRLGGRGGVGWGGGARRATKRIRRATEASNNQLRAARHVQAKEQGHAQAACNKADSQLENRP